MQLGALFGSQRPKVGRLAIQFGAAFALAMAFAGVLMFVVAKERLIAGVDQSLVRDRDRLLYLPPQAAFSRRNHGSRPGLPIHRPHIRRDACAFQVAPLPRKERCHRQDDSVAVTDLEGAVSEPLQLH